MTPQQIHLPTYHPHNTQQRSRRLDYMLQRGVHAKTGGVAIGSRHLANSDHDLVWVDIDRQPPLPTHTPTWGKRRYVPNVDLETEVGAPLTQTDTHQAISQLAQRLTKPGAPSERFHESPELREARRQAHAAPAHLARAAWKQVAKKRKQEQRRWHQRLVDQASQANWGGQTSAGPPQPRTGWHHHLTDSSTWKEDLRSHFRGIFAKAPAARTAGALGDIRQALTRLCKHTPWRPFTQGDLIWATRTWKKGKSTGPDAITHELLWMLLREPSWSGFPTPAHVQ